MRFSTRHEIIELRYEIIMAYGLANYEIIISMVEWDDTEELEVVWKYQTILVLDQ